jgi:hypothetical protein
MSTKKQSSVPSLNTLVVFKSIEKKSMPLKKKVTDLVIKSQKDFDLAGQILKQLKDLDKSAKAEEAKIADPLKEALAATKLHFKPFHDSVAQIEADTKGKMIQFMNKQQAEQVKLAEKVESGEIKKASTFLRKSEELNVSGSVNTKLRKIKKLVISKESLIPREYLIPDETKIKLALEAGVKVPGCRIDLVDNLAI